MGTAHYRWLLGAGALGLLLWWAWQPSAEGPVAPADVAPAPAPGAEAAVPAGRGAPPAPPAPPIAAEVPPAVAVSPPPAPREEVCGVGTVPMQALRPSSLPTGVTVSPGLHELPDHLGRHALDAARQRVLAVLDRGSVPQRVAASVWRDVAAAGVAAPRAGPAEAEALVREAAAGADVAAVGAALRLCDRLPDAAACERLLVAAARRLDPGNARWHALVLAEAPGDAAAWRALLQAPAWRSGFGETLASVRPALPADLPPYLQHMLAYEALTLEMTRLDNLAPSMRRCRLDGPPGERAPRADCDRLAQLLLDRSDTLLMRMFGLRTAETAGWPVDRLQPLRAELDTLQRAMHPLEARHPLGCAAVQASARYFDDLAREGELAALRALLRR